MDTKITIGKSKGQKHHRGRRSKYEVNIKMNLKETQRGNVARIKLA
jgi:hypothetical protein